MQWTDDTISPLAPNASTEKRGKTLANTSKWTGLSTNYEAIWGNCKGSGAQPYNVQINLKGPKFKCSCPVRRLPCKHCLGLLFLYANNSAAFKHEAPPAALANWLAKHAASTESVTQASGKANKSEEAIQKAEKAKEKRWQQRLILMESGILTLEQWLQDMIRQGIANVNVQQTSFWNSIAAKMVDAKLPSISVFLKETHQIIKTKHDWSELVVARLGVLYGWVMAFKKRQQLSPSLQHALFERLGKTTTKQAVIEEGHRQKDEWLVLGNFEGVDVEGRKFRRVWLYGWHSNKNALLLDYAFGAVDYERRYHVGSTWKGEIAYYSPAYPQRATWIQSEFNPDFSAVMPLPTTSFKVGLKAYCQALTKNPWLQQFPMLLEGLIAHWTEKSSLLLLNEAGLQVPLVELSPDTKWKILALSGGQAIDLIGEWDGLVFRPLSYLDSIGLPKKL